MKHFLATGETLAPPTIEERIAAARKHLYNSVKWKGERLGIFEMRRHWGNYVRGIANVKEYRMRLVTADTLGALDEVLEDLLMSMQLVLQ